jgi:hypothetical protein
MLFQNAHFCRMGFFFMNFSIWKAPLPSVLWQEAHFASNVAGASPCAFAIPVNKTIAAKTIAVGQTTRLILLFTSDSLLRELRLVIGLLFRKKHLESIT